MIAIMVMLITVLATVVHLLARRFVVVVGLGAIVVAGVCVVAYGPNLTKNGAKLDFWRNYLGIAVTKQLLACGALVSSSEHLAHGIYLVQ